MLLHVVSQDVADLINRRRDQSADDLDRKIGFATFEFLFDHRDEAAQRLAFGVGELHAVPRSELQEERHQVFGVDVDAAQEVRRDDEDMRLEAVVGLYLQDMLRSDDEERVLFQPVFFQVGGEGRFAFGSHADDESVEASRKPEYLHLRGAAGGDAFPQRAGAFLAAGHGDQLAEGEAGDRSFCVFAVHSFTRFPTNIVIKSFRMVHMVRLSVFSITSGVFLNYGA